MSVVLLGFVVIILRGSAANYWITPAELKSGGALGRQRVAGQVVYNSMNWDRATGQMTFKIKADGEKVVLPVVYRGIVPETFVGDSRVIVEGAMGDRVFEAEAVLVKCPENYLPEKAVGGFFQVFGIEGTLYR